MSAEDIRKNLKSAVNMSGSFNLDAVQDEDGNIIPQRAKQEELSSMQFLPQDCPLTVLGKSPNNMSYWFHTYKGIVVKYNRKDFNKTTILQLFEGCTAWLYAHYHQWKKSPPDDDGVRVPVPDTSKFDVDKVYEAIFNTAGECDIIEIESLSRGLGAWDAENGDLVINNGKTLQIFNCHSKSQPKTMKPRIVGEGADMVIYESRQSKTMIKDKEPSYSSVKKLAGQVLADFKTWNWANDIYPELLLGFTIAMFFGGALDWRSMVWITGDGGDGKSYLQKYINQSFGGWSILAEYATEAGIRQTLKSDSLGFQYDEAEGEALTDDKMNDIKRFMRISASGARAIQGSSGGEAQVYKLRSSFLFSSIYTPAFNPADDSRIVQMLMRKNKQRGVVREKFDKYKIRGQFLPLLTFFCHNWWQYKGWELVCWEWLCEKGLSDRLCDVYAPLLAFSYVLTDSKEIRGDVLDEKYGGLVDLIMNREESPEYELLLKWLAEYQIRQMGGDLISVGKMLDDVHNNAGFDGVSSKDFEYNKLKDYGIYYMGSREESSAEVWVANSHSKLSEIFKETNWRSSIKGRKGIWSQVFKRNKDIFTSHRMKIRGKMEGGYKIPIRLLVDVKDDKEQDEDTGDF